MKLAPDFESQLQDAVLDAAERELVGRRDNLVFQAVQEAHDRLREYGNEHEYDVEPIIESFVQPRVQRSRDRLVVRWGWTHEAMLYMELGTSDHTIQGNPVLSFVWEDPPQWVTEEFERARDAGGQFADGYRVFLPEVDVAGLPESRAVRDALAWLRWEATAR